MMYKVETPAVKATDTTDKKPDTPATRSPKKSEMQLRVTFTNDELLGIARKLAEANAELGRAEDDKKAVTAQLKAKCDGITARVGELSGKINSGFEYRNVQVETTYDEPKVGLKTTRRLDTLEIVDTEPMSLAERQIDLPLTPAPGTEPGAASMNATTGKIERKPLRTVTSSGVVATAEDGEGEDLQDDDAEGV